MDACPKYYRRKHRFPDSNCFSAFKEKYPRYENVDFATFEHIVTHFNQKVTDEIINNRNGVMLPELIGIIFIGKNKRNISAKSYTKYENNEQKKFTNTESENNLMKIFFTSGASKLPLSHYTCWTFKAIREFRRRASEIFKKDYRKYVDVKNIKINQLFVERQRTPSDVMSDIMKKYNELDL